MVCLVSRCSRRVLGRRVRRSAGTAAAMLLTALLVVSCGSVGRDKSPSLKLVPWASFGWDVNRANRATVCSAAKEACQPAASSDAAGGFRFTAGVAVNNDPASRHYHDVYVADQDNDRIQELSPSGRFVATFGWDVNATKDMSPNATQAERNLCTEREIETVGVRCRRGTQGTGAGQLTYPTSIAIDPSSGDIYVQEMAEANSRVDKYTADGRFVWAIGRKVNMTTAGDLCTQQEVDHLDVKCGPGAPGSLGASERDAFKFSQTGESLLAAGGPERLLYVGDEHGVQEIGADGRWRRFVSLTSLSAEQHSGVSTLAVDGAGNLYLEYQVMVAEPDGPHTEAFNVVRKLSPNGQRLLEFPIHSGPRGTTVRVGALAVGPSNLVAMIGQRSQGPRASFVGWLYDGATAKRISEFALVDGGNSVAFDRQGRLYIGATNSDDVWTYVLKRDA